MTFCYFSCLGQYCFRSTAMAALPARAAADARLLASLVLTIGSSLIDLIDLLSVVLCPQFYILTCKIYK